MDSVQRVAYHQQVLTIMSAIRRRVADMVDNKILDSLAAAHADSRLRIIHDDLRELLDFLDAAE